jgi:hypothetical protein
MDPSQDDYRWDVFVTYPNTGAVGGWVRDTVVPLLAERLQDQGIQHPRIFIDRSGIPLGANWPSALSEAHARSRTYLFVMSHPTLRSGWCLAEIWGGLKVAAESPRCFVIVYNDFAEGSTQHLDKIEQGFHAGLTSIQKQDLSRMSDLCPEDKGQPLYRELKEHLRKLASAIAHSIPLAPPWTTPLHPLPKVPISGEAPSWSARLGGAR